MGCAAALLALALLWHFDPKRHGDGDITCFQIE